MALIIGIENGLEKGFTEEELEFTNGFSFGVLCMIAGIGDIIPYHGAPKSWTVKDFYHRVKVTSEVITSDCLPKWFDLDFVRRMYKAGWSSNVGFDNNRTWKAKMKRMLFEDIEMKIKCEGEEE